MAIYDAGTASMTANGIVTGVGTTWQQPLTLIRVGATMVFKTNPVTAVTVAEILSDTSIRAFNTKSTVVPVGTQYFILAHDGITVQGLAQDVAETLRYYQSQETSIASLVELAQSGDFDFDRLQTLVNEAKSSETNAASSASAAAASQQAAATSQTQAASSASSAQAAYNNTVNVIANAGDAGTLVTLNGYGIAGANSALLQSLDWQQFNFTSSASYRIGFTNMTNVPDGLKFATAAPLLLVNVLGIDGNNIRVNVTTSADGTSGNNHRNYDVYISSAKGSRVFVVRELISVTYSQSSESAPTQANTARYRSLLDVYSKAESDAVRTIALGGTGATTAAAARANLDVYSRGEVSSRGFVSVKDFGAVGDGVTDDSDAIIRALSSSLNVYFPEGTYLQSKQIYIRTGHNLEFGSAIIQISDSLTVAAWRAEGANNFKISGGRFRGTGLDNTSGNGHLMLLSGCEYGIVDGVTFNRSSQDGLRLAGSRNMTISNINSFNNLSCGIQDRDGFNNSYSGCKLNYNGNTGVVSNTGGRGLLIWRCSSCTASNIVANNNTEYGIRVYSQSDDASPSRSILITGCQASDNYKIDLYAYNEGVLSSVIFSNCSVRRTTQPQGSMASLQGENVQICSSIFEKVGDILSTVCISIYNSVNARVDSVLIKNVSQAFSFSSSELVTISNVTARCSRVGFGGDVRYLHCNFYHEGTGTQDVAIDANTVKNSIIGCLFVNYYRNITWNSQGMVIVNNESRGTTDASLRMYGDGIPGLTYYGNRFDTVTNPTIIGSLTRTDNKSRAIGYSSGPPASLTWIAGDIIYNINPSGTTFTEKWICTASGTPGTWVSK